MMKGKLIIGSSTIKDKELIVMVGAMVIKIRNSREQTFYRIMNLMMTGAIKTIKEQHRIGELLQ